MDFLDLFLEKVLLVEEEDDGRGCEELVVADAVEEVQGLVHAVLQAKGLVGMRRWVRG